MKEELFTTLLEDIAKSENGWKTAKFYKNKLTNFMHKLYLDDEIDAYLKIKILKLLEEK